MRIERQIEYEAKNDAEAIRIAKERLGLDAVIISSRHMKIGGFLGFFKKEVLLVTAGILKDDPEEKTKESRERMVAFQHLLDARRAIHGISDPETAPSEVPSVSPSSGVSVSVAPITAAKSARNAYADVPLPSLPPDGVLRLEVDKIRETLEQVMERLDSGLVEKLPQADVDTLRPEVLPLLKGDMDRQTVIDISEEYSERGNGLAFREWLANQIPLMGSNTTEALGGKKVIFVGATGVGKTTTIAKLAAVQSLWDGRRVVLITADTYRIAAVEQLRTYAKILGIPIEIIFSPDDIEPVMQRHQEADLFLLDTAGRNHQDEKKMDELRGLYEAFAPDAVHLVLASNIKYRDMLNVVDRMGIIPLSALLFTKLDETSTYGPLLTLLRDFKLPLSFLTNGQSVPNDIEVARGDRTVDLLLGLKSFEAR